jgi:hypothetical protein
MSVEMNAGMEMPKYKCHKEVWALKIKTVTFDAETREGNRETDGSATIFPAEENFMPVKVDREYVRKHLRGLLPQQIVGGYYVVYRDGYASFSPATEFEDGYTLIK